MSLSRLTTLRVQRFSRYGWGVVFAFTAMAMTWPLVLQMETAIPMGWEDVATVPLFNLWTVWWNADRAAAGFSGYWDAPIFHPVTGTFLYSEAQPTTLTVAPLVWWHGHAVLAYNVYLLVSLWLNGVMTFRLLREQNFARWTAGISAVITQTLPFISWQLGVLQLIQIWPCLWTISAALRQLQQPRWRTACELGVAFAVTYLACNYWGLFLAVLLPPALLWYWQRHNFTGRSLAQLCLAATIAGSLVVPVVSRQWVQSRGLDWQREEIVVRSLSAHLRDYSDTPATQWLERWEIETPERHEIWPLGPGLLKLLTAVVGVGVGLCLPGHRRWTLLALTLGLLALWYSFGPDFVLWNFSPFGLLRTYLPGFQQIRSPFRFAVFVQLAVVWLAAVVIDRMIPRRSPSIPPVTTNEAPRNQAGHTSSPRNRYQARLFGLRWTAAVMMGLMLLAETRPIAQRLHGMACPESPPFWVEFLRCEIPRDEPVICMPMPQGSTVYDYISEMEWMLCGMEHRHPLLNGYSGFFPGDYVRLKTELVAFPNRGVPELQRLGARYAVVRRSLATEATIASHPATAQWVWLFGDEQQHIDIYRIPPLTDSAPAEATQPSRSAK
ncbi:hypothetical protein GC163_00795 [bacterium]|nr:hypothetical protein [bacterium]